MKYYKNTNTMQLINYISLLILLLHYTLPAHASTFVRDSSYTKCVKQTEGLPEGWNAKGERYRSGDGEVDYYSGNLVMLYAEKKKSQGVIVNEKFKIDTHWVNIKLDGVKFKGGFSIVMIEDEKNDYRRVIRSIPPEFVQSEGWLNNGWFSFNISEYMGREVYFQVIDLADLSDFNVVQVEFSNNKRGPETLDWYKKRVKEIMDNEQGFADSDPFRPKLHTAIPSGKSWDSNGLVYKDGLFHYFYLARPNNLTPFQGHKVSRDLVHWEERMPAIVPSHEFGEGAIWSGSAVIDNEGHCHIFYTGVGPDQPSAWLPRQGHAVSTDSEFNHFEKVNTSMITMTDMPVSLQSFRDPFVFRHDNKWYMTITGGMLKDGNTDETIFGSWDKKKMKAVLVLFESKDLYNWEYRGIVAEDKSRWVWEVSDLFEQDGRWFYSPGGREYHVGTFDFDTAKFNIEKSGKITDGLAYAHRSMIAPDGRRLMITRIKEGGDLKERKWEGSYSFVREWVLKDDVLFQYPIKELEVLRDEYKQFSGLVSNLNPVMNASKEYELIVEFDVGTSKKCGLEIRRSTNGNMAYRIEWDVIKQEATVIIIGKSGKRKLNENVKKWVMSPEKKTDLDYVKFHLFVDRGLVELIVDNQKSLDLYVEDIPLDNNGIAVFAEGGTAKVVKLERWNLKRK